MTLTLLPETWVVHEGDCLDLLRKLPDESVDACITDPPYGLSEASSADVEGALRAWLDGQPYVPKGKGFMGKSWDAFVPGPEVWKECFRVLKPGGHLLAFAGTRTQDLMGISIRLAGFRLRDAIRVEGTLAWMFGSGFPKSLDVGKAIDAEAGAEREVIGFKTSAGYPDGGTAHYKNRAKSEGTQVGTGGMPSITVPATEQAKAWEGWGTALKPAYEPVLLFRKPPVGTIAENVLKYGVGAMNIDGCRVATSDGLNGGAYSEGGRPAPLLGDERTARAAGMWGAGSGAEVPFEQPSGRWPPNLVLCHTPDCSQVGTTTVEVPPINRYEDGAKHFRDETGHGAGHPYTSAGGGTETIPVWKCAPGCPVGALNDQSGITRSGAMKHEVGSYEGESVTPFLRGRSGPSNQHGDSGGAARFFPQFTYTEEDAPFLYCAKTGRTERNEGLDGPVNNHPTVKPIALLQWLMRLVTPKGGLVLDNFAGSGSGGCAAVREGFRYLGIEREPNYVAIARERISFAELKARGGVKDPFRSVSPAEEPVTDSMDLDTLLGWKE